jgi:hypothetical protein
MSRRRPHGLIDRALRRMSRRGEVPHSRTPTTLTIHPSRPGGFPVRLAIRRGRPHVSFERWSRAFTRNEDALDCLEFGLSDSCRLAVEYRGRWPVAWTIESREHGCWSARHRVSRWLRPFWGTRRMEYRQNRVFVDHEEMAAGADG